MAVSHAFTQRRQLGMAGRVAKVIRLAFEAGRISSLLGLEGVLRSALRADLCLRGWQWADANQAAVNIVAVAHSLLGAERPDWYEGQPEYVVSDGLLIERTRCKLCHRPLPEERRKYCSQICGSADSHRLVRVRAASDKMVADMAVHEARRAQI